jgi:uncharacterized membrane protein
MKEARIQRTPEILPIRARSSGVSAKAGIAVELGEAGAITFLIGLRPMTFKYRRVVGSADL